MRSTTARAKILPRGRRIRPSTGVSWDASLASLVVSYRHVCPHRWFVSQFSSRSAICVCLSLAPGHRPECQGRENLLTCKQHICCTVLVWRPSQGRKQGKVRNIVCNMDMRLRLINRVRACAEKSPLKNSP
ncbi:unnamed protein product [Discosporangium mesarthrocarpum]